MFNYLFPFQKNPVNFIYYILIFRIAQRLFLQKSGLILHVDRGTLR